MHNRPARAEEVERLREENLELVEEIKVLLAENLELVEVVRRVLLTIRDGRRLEEVEKFLLGTVPQGRNTVTTKSSDAP